MRLSVHTAAGSTVPHSYHTQMLSLRAADLPPPSAAAEAQAPLPAAQHQQLLQNRHVMPGDILPGGEGFAAAADAEQPAAGGMLGRVSDSIAAGAKGIAARISDSMAAVAGVAAVVAGGAIAVARALSGSDASAGKCLIISACLNNWLLARCVFALQCCTASRDHSDCMYQSQPCVLLTAARACLLPDWYTVLCCYCSCSWASSSLHACLGLSSAPLSASTLHCKANMNTVSCLECLANAGLGSLVARCLHSPPAFHRRC